jgi:putative membrane-bound dehydrogenase-like protein
VLAGIAAAPDDVRGQGFAPAEAARKMTTVEGLEATLFASEPDVRQAIFVKCDDRGRLWTIQYLQYPNPAGLERVKVDRWSRTEYDRIPEPPPRGPRGADRITICDDVDGDGRADRFRDFVDGLNLVTGVEFGHGGVYVLNVPYLLFYPDKNRDDVPDGDPEVLLSGFGMEDAQSLANHLTWGPDGWLYGVNGSTTTCRIRGVEFQSGVWRYHPRTREFELFCEGGYNCYGLTFDRHGELFYSTNGGPFIHAMQGAYYYKSFGKHGPLHNLYAYHYFGLLACDQAPGGPPTGGTIYRGDAFPAPYRDTFIAGNFLGHTASWWTLRPAGSTFSAAYGGVLVDAHDTWFGPTDMCLGPDGAMYLSDFHDQRTAHPDPDANWDVRNGRIFKIRARGGAAAPHVDVTQASTAELTALLRHRNAWYADRARVELAARRDASAAPELLRMARQTASAEEALQGLWGLEAVGAFDATVAGELLGHPEPYVRAWTVRLLGDRRRLDPQTEPAVRQLAERETHPVVLAQLAASAKRWPPSACVPLAAAVLRTGAAASDERVGWLAWWAAESCATADPERLLATFAAPEAWGAPTLRANALRLVRRWAAEGTADAYAACARAATSAPQEQAGEVLDALRQGLAERGAGLHGVGQGGLYADLAAEEAAPPVAARAYEPVAGPLRDFIAARWRSQPDDPLAIELALRAELPGARQRLHELLELPAADDAQRIAQLRLLREAGDRAAAATAGRYVAPPASDEVAAAALDVIDALGSAEEVAALTARYRELSPGVQGRARDLFFGRPESALAFLQLVENGDVPAGDAPLAQLAQLAAHRSEAIDALVRRHWGQIGPGTSEEKLATIRRFSNDLRAGTGDRAAGKTLFAKHCAVCHRLFGEGNQIGPELTAANRQDAAALLGNLVDPSAVIRNDYTSYVVLTEGGRAVTGLLAEQDAAQVTVLDAQNRRIALKREEIASIEPSDVSLMPERLLDQLTPQELRDLFAYLQQ